MLDLDGNDVALTEPGTTSFLVTLDGRYVLVQARKGAFEFRPIDGGDPKPITFLQPGDRPIRFSSNGKDIFVRNSEKGVPGVNLYRVSLATGARTLLRHLQSPRTTVANEVAFVDVTPDGTGYAYGYRQTSTALYAVNGLK